MRHAVGLGAQSGGMVVVEFNEQMNCRWGNPREFHLGSGARGTSLDFFCASPGPLPAALDLFELGTVG